MTDRELSDVNEQTQRALEALNTLQRETGSELSAAAESGVGSQRPSFKLLSAEESARGGLGDVFELPIEYEEDDDEDEDHNNNNNEKEVQSGSNRRSDAHRQIPAEVDASVSAGSPVGSNSNNTKGAPPVEGQEEDALINRVGRQQQSGYKSRMQELEFRRRILATVVVVLIGAAIATLIAFVVYKSGVVDGKYRLSQHPHGLGEKNHLKGSAPESTHAHAHKMPPAFPGISAEGSIGQDVAVASASEEGAVEETMQDVVIGNVVKNKKEGSGAAKASSSSGGDHAEAKEKKMTQRTSKKKKKKKPRLEGPEGKPHSKEPAVESNAETTSDDGNT